MPGVNASLPERPGYVAPTPRSEGARGGIERDLHALIELLAQLHDEEEQA